MACLKIFITGASGCIGHYVTEALIQQTDHELYLLLRNPNKLQINVEGRSGIHLLEGDLRELDRFQDLLSTVDVAILIATAWGGDETYEINVTQTIQLVKRLQAGKCRQILYFSTESILDQNNHLLPQAGELGTDYIRTKFICFQELEQFVQEAQGMQEARSACNISRAPLQITALYPTLVFGGDGTKPYSHLTSGLPEILRWLWLIRFFRADASFHFIHGADIAQVVVHLVQHPPLQHPPLQHPLQSAPADRSIHKLVLGNAPITVDHAIEAICAYYKLRLYFRIPLYIWLAQLFIRVFNIQMADWDRFCLQYRHFVHADPVNPATFGLPPQAGTIAALLDLCGVKPR